MGNRATAFVAALCLGVGCSPPPMPPEPDGGVATGGGAAAGGGSAAGGGAAVGGGAAAGGGMAAGGGTGIDAGPTSLCVLSAEPTTLDLGQVPFFGLTQPFSVTRTLTLRNVGMAAMPPNAAENCHLGKPGGVVYWELVPMNADSPLSAICVGEFDTTTGTCTNAAPPQYDGVVGLRANTSLDIPVRVQPVDTGKNMEWTLRIYSDDPMHPEVDVDIKAQSVQLPPCNYSVTPAQLDFGLVPPPTSVDLPFTVTNLGTSPGQTCLITSLDLKPGTDPVFSLPDGPVFQKTLQPGASLKVVVRASPQGSASATVATAMGAVSLGISSPNAPVQTIPLQASIATSCLIISPRERNFGTVQKDCNSGTTTFDIYNTCLANLSVASFTMRDPAGEPAGGPHCPGSSPCPEFLLAGLPSFTSGSIIPPATTNPATFAIKYHPINYGPDDGTFVLHVMQNGQMVSYVVPLHGNGDTMGLNVDTFVQPSKPKTDILFVVDNSCSMTDKQTALGQNFASFIQYANQAGIDYHLGVVDTDFDCGSNVGKLHGDASNPKVLTPTTPLVDTLFAAKVKVGTGACGSEAAAQPALLALTAPLITSDNAGFLRTDAVLAIVVVSDAGDQSPQTAAFYANALRNIKGAGRPDDFTFNDIGPFGNPTASCSYDDFTDVTKNDFLVAQFNGVKEEICTPDWSAALQQIGQHAFATRTHFYLNVIPDLTGAAPVAVTNDTGSGPQPLSPDAGIWSYDATSNAIVFQPQFAPSPGDVVSVTYLAPCN